MRKNKIYQQGDVILKKIASMPAGKKKSIAPGTRGLVLAEGEHTGHAHVIAAVEDVDMVEVEGGIRYLDVKDTVQLTHEEHDVQVIAPGVYEIGRVVEVDPFSGEIRLVAD